MWKLLMAGLVAAASLWSSAALAAWPEGRVNFIVPASAGTALDTAARVVAEGLSKKWSQPVTVENRVGAGGVVGTKYLLSLPADGYNLLYAGPTLYSARYVYPNVDFDPIGDFRAVARSGAAHMVLLVGKGSRFKTLDELLAQARSNPKKITFSMAGAGTFSDMTAVMLQNLAKVEMLAIPYKEAGTAVTDVMAGRVDMTFTAVATGLGQVKSGDMRALATSGAKRSATMPDVPTLQELGVEGYDSCRGTRSWPRPAPRRRSLTRSPRTSASSSPTRPSPHVFWPPASRSTTSRPPSCRQR
jgi:tripartite-type tricarboxylate transporter receptor subunit TctC